MSVFIASPCLMTINIITKFNYDYKHIGGVLLANIKSAKKRILVTKVRNERNKAVKSAVKTAIKKVYSAIESNDKVAANEALVSATSIINKAATKGVYHKNNAARKVSRLTLAVNKMA